MALTIEIKHPDFEDDVDFDVAGILVKNGGSVELTEDQERLLVSRRQKPAKDVLEAASFVKVKGTSLLSKKDIDEILPTHVSDLPADTQEAVETTNNEGSEA